MDPASSDLPDPVQDAPPNAENNGDELLAQMAGEEIDRLLAEAGELPVDAATPAHFAAKQGPSDPDPLQAVAARVQASPATSTADLDSDTARQLDALFDELTAGSAVPPATGAATSPTDSAPPAVAAATDPVLERQIDDLFEQESASATVAPSASIAEETGTPSSPPSGADEPATTAPAGAVTEELTAVVAASVDPAEQTGALERQVLSAQLLDAASFLSEDELNQAIAPHEVSNQGDRVSLHVRVLEWLNLPLRNCSDAALDVMGKVAVMHLVFALLILAYIAFFRRG